MLNSVLDLSQSTENKIVFSQNVGTKYRTRTVRLVLQGPVLCCSMLSTFCNAAIPYWSSSLAPATLICDPVSANMPGKEVEDVPNT